MKLDSGAFSYQKRFPSQKSSAAHEHVLKQAVNFFLKRTVSYNSSKLFKVQ